MTTITNKQQTKQEQPIYIKAPIYKPKTTAEPLIKMDKTIKQQTNKTIF